MIMFYVLVNDSIDWYIKTLIMLMFLDKFINDRFFSDLVDSIRQLEKNYKRLSDTVDRYIEKD